MTDNTQLCLSSLDGRLLRRRELPAGTTTSCLVYDRAHDVFLGVRDGLDVVAFNASTLQLVATFPCAERAVLCAAFFEPLGRFVTAGVEGVRIWEARTAAKLFTDSSARGGHSGGHGEGAQADAEGYGVDADGRPRGGSGIEEVDRGEPSPTKNGKKNAAEGVFLFGSRHSVLGGEASVEFRRLAQRGGGGIGGGGGRRNGDRRSGGGGKTALRLELRHHCVHGEAWVQALYADETTSQLFAAAGRDVQVWSIQRGTLLMCLQGLHDLPVTAVIYCAVQKYVVTGSADRSIRVWDASKSKLSLSDTLLGHTRRVVGLREDTLSRTLLSVSDDGTIKRWCIETAQCWDTLALSEPTLGDHPTSAAPGTASERAANLAHHPPGPAALLLWGDEPPPGRDGRVAAVPIAGEVHLVEMPAYATSITRCWDPVVALQVVHWEDAEPAEAQSGGGGGGSSLLAKLRGSNSGSGGLGGAGQRRGVTFADGGSRPQQLARRSSIARGLGHTSAHELAVLARGAILHFLDAELGMVNKVLTPSPFDKCAGVPHNANPAAAARAEAQAALAATLSPDKPASGIRQSAPAPKALPPQLGASKVSRHAAGMLSLADMTAMLIVEGQNKLLTGWSTGAVEVYNVSTGVRVYSLSGRIDEEVGVTCFAFLPSLAAATSGRLRRRRSTVTSTSNYFANAREAAARMAGLTRNKTTPPAPTATGGGGGGGGTGNDSEGTSQGGGGGGSAAPWAAYLMAKRWRKAHNDPHVVVGYSSGQFIVVPVTRKDGAQRNKVQAHSAAILALYYVKERQAIVSVGAEGAIKLWDVADLSLRAAYKIAPSHARLTVVALHGAHEAICGFEDGSIEVWSLASRPAAKLPQVASAVSEGGVKASSGGARALRSPWEGGVLPEKTLKEHTQEITALAVGASEEFFASASMDCTVMLWATCNRALLKTFNFREPVAKMCALNADFDLLVVIGQALVQINTAQYKRRAEDAGADAEDAGADAPAATNATASAAAERKPLPVSSPRLLRGAGGGPASGADNDLLLPPAPGLTARAGHGLWSRAARAATRAFHRPVIGTRKQTIRFMEAHTDRSKGVINNRRYSFIDRDAVLDNLPASVLALRASKKALAEVDAKVDKAGEAGEAGEQTVAAPDRTAADELDMEKLDVDLKRLREMHGLDADRVAATRLCYAESQLGHLNKALVIPAQAMSYTTKLTSPYTPVEPSRGAWSRILKAVGPNRAVTAIEEADGPKRTSMSSLAGARGGGGGGGGGKGAATWDLLLSEKRLPSLSRK